MFNIASFVIIVIRKHLFGLVITILGYIYLFKPYLPTIPEFIGFLIVGIISAFITEKFQIRI